MSINMDLQALLDDELSPAKAQRVWAQLEGNPSAMRKYRQFELQKMLLILWAQMNIVIH